MTSNLVIALDCMGGDRAPQVVIEGADIIASNNFEVQFLLFGNSKKILPIINHCRYLKGRFNLIHTDEEVPADEKPSNALRKLTKSSMRLAIDAVKDGKAQAIISAGNTGALMAIAKVVLRPLPLIDRPAIVTSIPNKKNKGTVFLDMGANIECDSAVLFQFAVMGRAFAKSALKIENPKIGILNVGSEELKGHEHVKNVANILKNSDLKNDFYGYVEGDDIAKGTVDVVVTDGFTGNITLKTIEGTAKFITSLVKEGFTSSIWAKIGYLFASNSITKATRKIDPRLNNGAMLVGLNGIAVKSHGSTDSIGFSNAIKVAISLLENQINDKIIAEIKANESAISNALNSTNSSSESN
ncbi:MAG: phosphate acyltransferase PlsX [Proteobacteria bacterium]|nr:phosphate acyltransferase PlsX [Pseudomonadota bacterium]NCA28928.1 phosphate acyltransferase PlsX [Pseudomonadota bacterium]